jgi:predicted ATP-grasp superfamily ATP-dependent carboligase
VLDLLRSQPFDLVIPCCDDRSILPFHIHRDVFSSYRVAIPNVMSMDLLFDKECTRKLCIKLGVPVAPGARVDPYDSAEELAARFGLPLVIKPRRSYGVDRLDAWGKVFIVESEIELQKVLSTLAEPRRYLVEGYFEGEGVSVSVLAESGHILHAFQHRRLREGRGGSSSYRMSEPVNPDLYRACEKICTHTGLTGVCMFEFRWNSKTRDWVLLETNARFWGSSPLPLSLGVDFPRYLYDLLVHQRRHNRVQYAVGVRSRNVMLDGLNLFANVGRLRRDQMGAWIAEFWDFLTQPIRWLTGSEKSDTFVIDDLKPALWECATLLKGLIQRRERNKNPQLRRRNSEQAA